MTEVSLPQTLIFGHLWQSVALAAVLAGVLIFGKRMRGSTRYGLSVAAFVASLALPLAAFIPGETLVAGLLKQLNAPVSIAPIGATTTVDAKPAEPFWAEAARSNGAPDWAINASAGVLRNISNTDTPVTETVWGKQAMAEGAPSWALQLGAGAIKTAMQPAVTVTPPPAAPAAPMFTVPEIKLPDLGLPLLGVWLAGVLFMLARTGRDLIAVERLVARAKPADLPEALKRRMVKVRVAVSAEAPGPMAAGLFHPTIILPESIALASPGMAALLEHERAHIERRDMLAALGQRVVLALLWWSPALYWISRRIDEEREVACDEAAVDRTGDAKAFARSLTKQAENQLWARAPRLAVGAIGPRSQFGRRIKRLIEIAKTGGSPAKYSGRLAFAGLALAVAVAAMVTPRFTAEAQQAETAKDSKAIDLTSPKASEQAKAGEQRSSSLGLVGGDHDSDDQNYDFNFDFDHGDFAFLGEEIGALMASLGDEMKFAFADMSPELKAEMEGLSAEMAALGVDISATVSQEVLKELPAIMEEVRRALEEAGVGPDNVHGWADFQDFDSEELREALQEAREEMKTRLGPEMQAQIRAAMEEARAEIAAHRDEIAAAMKESQAGMAIAREAMAQARAEIAAARARGDFDKAKTNFKFDFDKDVLEELRKAGIEVSNMKAFKIRDGGSDEWQLYRAAEHCQAEDVSRLITEKKVDVNKVIAGDGTALIAAARENCADAARALINAGADVNKASVGDGNPLIMAAANHSMEVARLLINRGADVNAYVPADETALINAAREGDLDMVKLLVENGAKVNLAYTVEGKLRSPLNMAEKYHNDDVAAYLRSKGAVAAPKPAN